MISCLCMYHGRNWCLDEAVESFYRQDYTGDSELVILNDCTEQTLVMPSQDPRIRIYNLEREILDLSRKQNVGVEKYCRGDWVALWDDDDISLPHRLSLLSGLPGALAFCSSRAWYVDDNCIINIAANRFAGSAFFNRDYYIKSGGSRLDSPPDASAWQSMVELDHAVEVAHRPEEIPYIYRWGGIGVHDSAISFRRNESKHSSFHSRVIADRRFKRGLCKIVPHWKRDYVNDVRNALTEGRPVL